MSGDPESDPRIVRVRGAREPEERPEQDVSRRAARAATGDPLRARQTLIEKVIRDAMAAGAFDNLPYQGKPLPKGNDEAAGDMASAFRILRNAGAAPTWIEADKEVRRLLAERDVILERASRSSRLSRARYRDQLRALVDNHNRQVLVLNHEAPSARLHRRPLDLAHEMAELERRWPN